MHAKELNNENSAKSTVKSFSDESLCSKAVKTKSQALSQYFMKPSKTQRNYFFFFFFEKLFISTHLLLTNQMIYFRERRANRF